ncbi:MAG: response regulator [Candidatus Viridilinea halotolerans]|uniref:Response regulator n=1 Tax=Candidatus Viridilinea halotolerans TaxID=2491704 RepID=A0A426U0N6_9CHLR|nr:MAG: response regulator [Candidatus Viridilinea halotolerans]
MSEWHLLLIEDSDEDVEAMVRGLRRQGLNLIFHHCATGDQALDFLYRRGPYAGPASAPRPDLILLDLNLPGTDGRALLAVIKDDQELQSIPVVVLTTSNNPKDIATCYRYGANSYQIKPVDYGRFKQALQTMLDYWLQTATLPQT